MLAHALRKNTNAIVCRYRFRIPDDEPAAEAAPTLVSISRSN